MCTFPGWGNTFCPWGNTFLRHKETRKSASLLDFRAHMRMETVGVENIGRLKNPYFMRVCGLKNHFGAKFGAKC